MSNKLNAEVVDTGHVAAMLFSISYLVHNEI